MTRSLRISIFILLLSLAGAPIMAMGQAPIDPGTNFDDDNRFNTGSVCNPCQDNAEDTLIDDRPQESESKQSKSKIARIPPGTVVVEAKDVPNPFKVTEIRVPEGVERIADGAFANCSSLQRIELPQSLKEIGDAAFEGCSALKQISIPQRVEKIGKNAFGLDCSAALEVDPKNANFSSDSGVLFDKSQRTLLRFPRSSAIRRYTVPKTVKTIGHGAFSKCVSLLSVELPIGVKEVSDCAFQECESLVRASIPSSVERIGVEAFWRCSALTNVELPASVTRIEERAFLGCSALRSVVMPSSVQFIGAGAFWNCDSLQYVVLPKGIKKIGEGTFAYCASLRSVVVPEGVEAIDAGAFAYCEKLNSVTLPASVKAIDNFAFDGSPVKLRVAQGSYAERWAQEHKINYGRIAPTYAQPRTRRNVFYSAPVLRRRR